MGLRSSYSIKPIVTLMHKFFYNAFTESKLFVPIFAKPQQRERGKPSTLVLISFKEFIELLPSTV